MNIKKKLLIALTVGLGLGTNVQAQTAQPFHAGDRVVFLGNSITDGGHYHSFIWLYYMTHFPNMRITCFNAGVGGDDVKQMTYRFDYEVLPKKPTVMTFTWGMNDSHYFEWGWKNAAEMGQKAIDTAIARYMVMDAKLKKHPEIRKIFILGSPYDETTKSNKKNYYPGKAACFEKMIDFQAATAKKNGYGIVDFNHPMIAINEREQKRDSLFSLTPNDRIHPDWSGHMVMAYLFLKDQGLANKPVADFSVNAKSKAVTKSVNCAITNVMGTDENISFNYLANALPYPVDTTENNKGGWGGHDKQSDGLKYVPFIKEFNQEVLSVKGLKDGIYKLSMDGQVIGQWSASDIAAGINLAEQVYTPEYQQAMAILHLNEERLQVEHRLRQYAWMQFDLLKQKGLLYANNKAAMDTVLANRKNGFVGGSIDAYSKAQYKIVRDGWQAEQDGLINTIYAMNKPKTHKVTLQLVK